MKTFLQKKLVIPLTVLLKQGISPARLALAVSLAIVIATVPVFGASTLLCLAAIALFRLNPTAVLLVNQFAYPLQFLLYLPFMRTGAWLFGKTILPFSVTQVFDLFKQNLLHAMATLWWATVYALVVWLLAGIPFTLLLCRLLTPLFVKIKRAVAPATGL